MKNRIYLLIDGSKKANCNICCYLGGHSCGKCQIFREAKTSEVTLKKRRRLCFQNCTAWIGVSPEVRSPTSSGLRSCTSIGPSCAVSDITIRSAPRVNSVPALLHLLLINTMNEPFFSSFFSIPPARVWYARWKHLAIRYAAWGSPPRVCKMRTMLGRLTLVVDQYVRYSS